MNLKSFLFSASLAFCLPGSALACEYLSEHFELCSEDTPWATGTWENGGDSATLYVDQIGYAGYEDYNGSEKTISLNGALSLMLDESSADSADKLLLRDRFSIEGVKIVRFIETHQFQTYKPTVRVFMIAQFPKKARIFLGLEAPEGTQVAELDRLSREFAALVQPRQGEN